jgi:hypothetical protein
MHSTREHPVVERASSDRKISQVIQTPTINGVIVLVDATSSLFSSCRSPIPLTILLALHVLPQILKSQRASLQAKISSSLQASSFK